MVVRRLDDGAVTWLAGTERASPAIWSPDSRSVAFLRDGELKVVDVATRGARTIGMVPADVRDGAWNHEGIILLGGSRLRRITVFYIASRYSVKHGAIDRRRLRGRIRACRRTATFI